ncbi:MAG: hypothetical protein JJE02_09395 [Propionibacteriales bacterium]|nr:hypothetical protein [Propionibacteriales bacterium]
MSARLVWFAAGTAAGVYSTIKARRAAYRMSPSGVADQANALLVGARAFSTEMRVGMLARQYQIARNLDLDAFVIDETDKDHR